MTSLIARVFHRKTQNAIDWTMIPNPCICASSIVSPLNEKHHPHVDYVYNFRLHAQLICRYCSYNIIKMCDCVAAFWINAAKEIAEELSTIGLLLLLASIINATVLAVIDLFRDEILAYLASYCCSYQQCSVKYIILW